MNDASTIDAEDDQDTVTPKVEAKPEAAPSDRKLATPAPKTQVMAQDAVMALIPRSLDEAWKMADAFYVAGMVPKSLEGKGEKETKAKVMLAFAKAPNSALAP